MIADQKTNTQIIDIITRKKAEAKALMDRVQLGIFEKNTGKSNREEVEIQMNNILNKATDESGKVGLKSLSRVNRLVQMSAISNTEFEFRFC